MISRTASRYLQACTRDNIRIRFPQTARYSTSMDDRFAAYDEYLSYEDRSVEIIHKRKSDLLHDPVFNKGLGFPIHERERLGLRGLLPPVALDFEAQSARVMEHYWCGSPTPDRADGVSDEQVRKWIHLTELKDRNEVLYYKLLTKHFREMAPIVYTPTVGWACANYHLIYHRPRGMYFTADDRGQMDAMVYNWEENDVKAIVVTDGSRILGLGDLGIGGLQISIGKLDLYVAAAGFHPSQVLPCVIDVGTENERLLRDPHYLGLRQRRLRGKEYVAVVDEFVRAVMQRWPNAVLQFEDFSTDVASLLLNRYRDHHTMFNDDIQGTAATALAGIYGALKVLGRPAEAIVDMRFVVAGAGSAGLGVITFLHKAMVKHGLTPEEASAKFFLLDDKGLVTKARSDLPPQLAMFAAADESMEGTPLLETVRAVKPQALLGLTGCGGLFTEAVLEELAIHCERPVLFPMSNPTHMMECSAEAGQRACKGRAVFASGSPQPDVVLDGRKLASSQANNMYIFPGLALGAKLLQTGGVSDGMLMAAAESVPEMLTAEELEEGRVYPSLENIREISVHVADKVMRQAYKENLYSDNRTLFMLQTASPKKFDDYIRRRMYVPEYNDIVYFPPGILE